MRFSMQKEEPGGIPYGLIFGSMVVLALVSVRILPSFVTMLPHCPFRSLTGIPCPTCGSTRMFISLSKGEVLSALAMNPVMALVVLSALATFLFSFARLLFHLPDPQLKLTDREQDIVRVGVAGLLFSNWLYLCLFP